MSSLAQDEIGPRRGALRAARRADRRRIPTRIAYDREPDGVPPLPPARPRPRRLGDDDRPPLPVRHRRRRPARGAGRRLLGAAGRPRRQARPRGALPPDARDGLARAAGPRRRRAARSRLLAALRDARARRRDRVHAARPTSRRWSRPGSSPRRWPSSRAAGGPRSAPAFAALGLPMPPPARDPAPRPARTTARRSAGCGASSPRSARPTRGDVVSEAGCIGGRPDRARGDRTRRRSGRPLAEVPDPEIPVVSIVDLGHRRATSRSTRRGSAVELLPTFVGCPALDADPPGGRDDGCAGFGRPVDVRFDVPRPVDLRRITADGRRKLRAAGFAPPGPGQPDAPLLVQLATPVACPHCGSRRTVLENAFGPTQCRAIYYCTACRQPFEAFKPV